MAPLVDLTKPVWSTSAGSSSGHLSRLDLTADARCLRISAAGACFGPGECHDGGRKPAGRQL